MKFERRELVGEAMWHYAQGGATHGPVSYADLCALFASAELPLDTHVWQEGTEQWVEASTIDDLRGVWGKGFGPRKADPPPIPPGGAGHHGLSPIAPAPDPGIALAPATQSNASVAPRRRGRIIDEEEEKWDRQPGRLGAGILRLAVIGLVIVAGVVRLAARSETVREWMHNTWADATARWSPGSIRINRTDAVAPPESSGATASPAKPRPKPKLLTLGPEKPPLKGVSKSPPPQRSMAGQPATKKPTTRQSGKNRPPPRVVFTPAAD